MIEEKFLGKFEALVIGTDAKSRIHVFLEAKKKFRSINIRAFDVEGVHPNNAEHIPKVDWLEYIIKKDENYEQFGIDVPTFIALTKRKEVVQPFGVFVTAKRSQKRKRSGNAKPRHKPTKVPKVRRISRFSP